MGTALNADVIEALAKAGASHDQIAKTCRCSCEEIRELVDGVVAEPRPEPIRAARPMGVEPRRVRWETKPIDWGGKFEDISEGKLLWEEYMNSWRIAPGKPNFGGGACSLVAR